MLIDASLSGRSPHRAITPLGCVSHHSGDEDQERSRLSLGDRHRDSVITSMMKGMKDGGLSFGDDSSKIKHACAQWITHWRTR